MKSRLATAIAVLFAAPSCPALAAPADFIFHDGLDDADACTVPGLRRIVTSNITYGRYVTDIRPAVPVTEYENIWGHFNAEDGVTPWPAITGSQPVLEHFTRTSFLAAHFRTGSDTTYVGYFQTPYWTMMNADMAISTECGDFVYAPSGCIRNDVAMNDQLLGIFTFATNNASKCILQPNTDYWVNVKYTDPASTDGCAAGAQYCPLRSVLHTN